VSQQIISKLLDVMANVETSRRAGNGDVAFSGGMVDAKLIWVIECLGYVMRYLF
jgi:hypothetical protein